MRRVCVVTTSRADYGLIYWLAREIEGSSELELALLVTGTHPPSSEGTIREIIADDLPISACVEVMEGGDSPRSIARTVGRATQLLADSLCHLEPDMVVILGDRFEAFAAAQAAFFLGLPIAHLHGGEITEGAFDDSLRHAITKLSQLHFTAAPEYRDRVVQLGEDPSHVFMVGPMAIDAIQRVPDISRDALFSDLGVGDPSRQLFLCAYHPVTAAPSTSLPGLRSICGALEAFPDGLVLFTGVNADPGHRQLAREINEFVRADPTQRFFASNLGRERFLQVLRSASVLIGNSSSGIIEAPLAGTVTVNVGDRQKGRIHGGSVIHVEPRRDDVLEGIRRALEADSQKAASLQQQHASSPAEAVVRVLSTVEISSLRKKAFRDV